MEVKFGPNSVDEPNLLYKLQRKIKVFNVNNALTNRGYNLVASSSKYGIVFVASPNGVLSAYNLRELIDKDCEPKHYSVKLEVEPTHISVNCDQELLAVAGGQKLFIYKVLDFQSQNVLPSGTLNCDVNPGTYVSVLQWNPCIPEAIAIVFFDGTLLVCQVNTMQMKKLQTAARCLCWSPKGKQIATGNSDGTLCQFKPDLSPMKTVPAPKLFEGGSAEALAIYWISTYQFAVVFKNASDDSRPAVTIVNTPKGGQPTCHNYEDICYSLGSSRPWYYYLQGITQWNMILSSSSNSMEIATLGSADGSNWLQWCQTDEARPELPLTAKNQENYPVGISIDTCAIHQLPWGENEVLPTMPLLHVVSQTGLLSIFNIIYLNKAAPQICMPPEPLALYAPALTSEIPGDAPSQSAPPPPMYPVVSEVKPEPVPVYQQQPQEPPRQPSAPQILQVPQISAGSFFAQANLESKPFEPQQPNFGFSAVQPPPPPPEQKPDLRPVEATPPQPEVKLPVAPPVQPQPTQSEVDAALKSEQQRDELNKAKMQKELTDMLIKEVNEFQMELYKFTMKTRETESRLQRDIQNISTTSNLESLDTDKLIKECMLDGLRTAINQLKLELVRTCAIVAEARTYSDSKDLPQWAQADPLTSKRVDNIRKLAYYVQNQLDQARKALDIKWDEVKSNDPNNKQGRMIRPLLDEVYQPLVKQQEILMRQQAVLKTMQNTLKDCDVGPVFKSTSILRSTPFKKDLTKLTKNIINMKIEANERKKEPLLSSQKLDALRDVLSNHKPTKVKPVNVDLRHQLASMYKSYKKNVLERTEPSNGVFVKSEPVKSPMQIKAPPPTPVITTESKPDIIKESPKTYAPAFDMKPVKTGLAGVARTLFTDEPKVEKPKPFASPEPSSHPPATTITPHTKSFLKDLLQNKSQAAANAEAKNDANTFMGQNICSPTAFNFSKPPTAAAPSAIFASKPVPFTSVFGKYQQVSNQPDAKQQANATKPKSTDTGEIEAKTELGQTDNKPKDEKPLTNLFGLKSQTQNVPDVLSSTKGFSFGGLDSKAPTSPLTNQSDSKENAPEKADDSKDSKEEKTDENSKTYYVKLPNKPAEAPSPQPVITVDFQKEKNSAKDLSAEKSPASIFGAANNSAGPKITLATQPSTLFGSGTNVLKSTSASPMPATSPIFATSTGIQKSGEAQKATTSSEAVISTTIAKTTTAEMTSSQGSIFSSSGTQGSLFTSSTTPSIFSSAIVKPAALPSTTTAPSDTETTTTKSTTEPPKPQSSAFSTSNASSVFASANASAFGPKITTAPSLFTTSTATTTESVFGTSTTTSSIFGSTPTSAQSVFSAAVSKASFGSEAATQSIFGTTTTTTQSSVFGATTDPKSVFGTTPTPAAVFGTATTLPTQTSVFGTSTQSPASVFGTTTTQAPAFGGTTSTPSIFGTTSVTTQASVFGTPSPSTQAPAFGSPTQPSIFGTSAATTQASVFGTPTPTTQASVFGTPPSTQASVFGTPSQATQASVFGTPTTSQSASPFGVAESNLFAAASISTTSSNQGTGGSIFGPSPSGSVFGSSTSNVFGGKTTFGQPNPTAASIFGGGASFGQKPATDFWSGASNTATSGFGSSGFGQTPTTQASSIFGGSSGGSFSAPSTGPTFGSPQPTAFGSAEAQPSVFGSPQQTATPAFGGSSMFGSKPVFGQTTGFGSPPAATSFGSFGGFNKSPNSGFGGSATFGSGAMFGGTGFGNTSPGKVFGGAQPSFAAPTQSNATFESLATQNTLTFGNLAQQSGQPQTTPPPSFNASPSFTGWRG